MYFVHVSLSLGHFTAIHPLGELWLKCPRINQMEHLRIGDGKNLLTKRAFPDPDLNANSLGGHHAQQLQAGFLLWEKRTPYLAYDAMYKILNYHGDPGTCTELWTKENSTKPALR